MAPPKEILAVTIVLYSTHGHVAKDGRPSDSAEGVRAVAAFARAHHLTVVPTLVKHGNITLRGTSANLSKAFGVTRTKYTSSLGTFYGHPGAVYIPRNLSWIIQGVIGLHQFPVRRINSDPSSPSPVGKLRVPSFHPVQMARLYNFPEEFDGRGQTVALTLM
jgi:kumamolisin